MFEVTVANFKPAKYDFTLWRYGIKRQGVTLSTDQNV